MQDRKIRVLPAKVFSCLTFSCLVLSLCDLVEKNQLRALAIRLSSCGNSEVNELCLLKQ